MTQLLRLLYLSAAARRLDEDDLDEILFCARRNNAANGITGILLYMDDAFLQVLEGDPKMVEATLARIENDGRHEALRMLLRETCTTRRFPDWSMGFQHLERWRAGEAEVFELSHEVLSGHLGGQEDDPLSALVLNFWRLADRHVQGVSAARVGLPRAMP